MVWLVLVGGFLLFMGLIGAAHGLDRRAADRFGYRPLAVPNLAFMLLPQGALAGWAVVWGQGTWPSQSPTLTLALAALVLGALIFMLVILWRRTSAWIALAATGLMAIGAPILLLSMLFRELAESPTGQ